MFSQSHFKWLEQDTYRPQTKLREGNVFAGICLFTGGSHVTITHDALDLIVPTPSPILLTSAVADLGFPRGGGANSPGGGANI